MHGSNPNYHNWLFIYLKVKNRLKFQSQDKSNRIVDATRDKNGVWGRQVA